MAMGRETNFSSWYWCAVLFLFIYFNYLLMWLLADQLVGGLEAWWVASCEPVQAQPHDPASSSPIQQATSCGPTPDCPPPPVN